MTTLAVENLNIGNKALIFKSVSVQTLLGPSK
jgi:hypothetical protein